MRCAPMEVRFDNRKENACREDPHPLEEAEAYEALLAMKDGRGRPLHTADTLAKLGVTTTEILQAIESQNTVNPAGQVGGEPIPAAA